MPPDWVFDELPPSGARRGGDPSEHAFKHDLSTFVREVLQNANDQAITTPTVAIDLRTLCGPELAAFRESMRFDALAQHLRSLAPTRVGKRIKTFLDERLRADKLLLLRVADRNTVGLTGEEDRGDSHFRALCKDTLFSHKQTASAGGSFGLGKSVLWAFSGLSTVLFSSVLRSDPPQHRSPRIIGRAELPSHELNDRGFTGAGWFGRVVRLPHNHQRAESVWAPESEALARALFLDRDATSGTSILIVGFRDPTEDAEPSEANLARSIREHAARNFWPAMELAHKRLRVEVAGQSVDPLDAPTARPFVECWRARERASDRLESPGDVVLRSIPVELPRRRDQRDAVSGRVDLVVRLAAEGSREPGIGEIAWFRGAGMVVRYLDRSDLAASARPFHAVLACGEGRTAQPDASDLEIEQFLRAAEPPGHDDWLATPAVKDLYIKGYARALQLLKDRVIAELRDVLAPTAGRGLRGPDRLRKRFPIGKRGGEGSAPSAFHFHRFDARFDDGRWVFEGEIRPAAPGAAWCATIGLQELGDDGAAIASLAIAELRTDARAARTFVDVPTARIEAAAGVDAVEFSGSSVVLTDTASVGELGLVVTGELMGAGP